VRSVRLVVAIVCVAACACARSVQHRTAAAVPADSAVHRVMKRQVTNAVDAGDGDIRLRSLRQRLAANPGDMNLRMELASEYRAKGYPDLALEHYRFAAARQPSDAVQIEIAKTLRAMGLRPEALAELRGDSAVIESWRGIVLDEMGELVRAEAHHRAALAKQRGSDSLHNNLGYNLLLQRRTAEAAAEFRRALEIAPQSSLARNNLALALAADPKQALEQWRASGDPAAAHNNLAALYIQRGQYPDARRELHSALAYSKDHPAAIRNLQLIAELEGGAVQLPGRVPSRWKRFGTGFRNVLLGVEPPAPAARADAQAGVPEAGQQQVRSTP
jgi:Flp pilus assembly protein TadD